MTTQSEREYNGVRDRAYAAQKWAERGAWQPEQVIDELFDAISAGTPFYVICRRRDDTRHGRRPYPMGRGRRPVSARAALAMVGRFQNRVCRDRQAVRLRCSSGGDGQRCVRLVRRLALVMRISQKDLTNQEDRHSNPRLFDSTLQNVLFPRAHRVHSAVWRQRRGGEWAWSVAPHSHPLSPKPISSASAAPPLSTRPAPGRRCSS